MGLKKTANSDDRVTTLKMRRTEIKAKMQTMEEELLNISHELLSIEFSPFNVGDHVICEVVSGKSRKSTECILEFEVAYAGSTDKNAYVRPLKADGSLSGRHFQITSKTVLTPVK